MAAINNREFTQGQLEMVFSILDTGGTRAQVRAYLRRSTGRGASNETIRKLRDVHRQFRRSQGFDVKQGGTRGWLTDSRGSLIAPSRENLGKRFLSPSARPAPPLQAAVEAVFRYRTYDAAGRFIGVRYAAFEGGPDMPPILEQVRRAMASGDEYGSPSGPGRLRRDQQPSRRGWDPVVVKAR